MGALDVMEEDIEDNYRRDLAGTDHAENLLFDSIRPRVSIADMDHAAAVAGVFLDAIKKPSDQRFKNSERSQKSRIALNETRFRTFSRWKQITDQKSKEDMAALEKLGKMLKDMGRDRIQEWSDAVERAVKVRRDLDQIARAVSEEESRRADASQSRELAAKAHQLELFIEKITAEVSAESNRSEIKRDNSSAETDNQIKQRKATSEAALAELEAYAKHNLTGQGKYYRFTRNCR